MHYPKHLNSEIRRSLFLISVFLFLSLAARAQLIMLVNTTQNGDDVTARFSVNNFEDIVSMQFSINWNPDDLEFVQFDNHNLVGLTDAAFGTNHSGNGILTFSWFDADVSGVTLPDGQAIFDINFTSLTPENPELIISGFPLAIEITDSNEQEVELISNVLETGHAEISGKVFRENGNDCAFGTGDVELRGWVVKAVGENTFYANSNEFGEYNLNVLPGTYVVSMIPPNDLWEVCSNEQVVSLAGFATQTLDFGAKTQYECSYLEVDISTPRLRRCFDNVYTVNYFNSGTQTAENAYIEITFDDFLNFDDSTLPPSGNFGKTYIFDVDDIPPGDGGRFRINLNLSCDAELGQSHCTVAEIFPQESCLPVNPQWDGSSLKLNGECISDTLIQFEIQNNGGDMQSPLEFIIIEDAMIRLNSGNEPPIQLANNETHIVTLSANGSTFRMALDQTTGHPGNSRPTMAIEGCGENVGGSFSKGFVTQFPNDDMENFRDIDCQENVGSYDPNDKTGYPKGFCDNHTIHRETDIEYLIRFQNTGTDTAFNIVIKDTLSSFLNPASLRPGVSSHAYKYELLGEGVAQFTFENIMLPDSNVNEPASHGFVKFKIAQQPNLPIGTLIENNAAIYFDFNDPIITNTVPHTIGEGYVSNPTGGGDITISGMVTKPDGTPIDSVLIYSSNNCPFYTNADGFYNIMGLDTFQVLTISPTKTGGYGKCVTVLDLVKLRNHIVGFQPFDEAYQYISGDLNSSNSVTTFDLVGMRKLILGIGNPTNNSPWQFFDASYIPTIPPTIWPSVININGLLKSDTIDWIGINLGDVASEKNVPQSSLQPEFIIGNAFACSNEVVVPVRVNNFEKISGFQFSIQWDADILEYYSTKENLTSIPINEIAFSPEAGKLNIASVVTSDLSLPDGEVIFYIRFGVKGMSGSVTDISLNPSGIPFQVIGDSCAVTDPVFIDGSVEILEDLNFTGEANLTAPLCHNSVNGMIDLSVSGGTPPYVFNWNTGEMTEDIINLPSGNYECTVTDENGCELNFDFILPGADSLFIEEFEIINVMGSGNENGAIFIEEISGGTAPFEYLWSTGATTLFIANISEGNYSVTVTDANGCQFTQDFEVGFTTGISPLEELGVKVNLQPNPVLQNQNAFLNFDLTENHYLTIKIVEPTGRILNERSEYFEIGNSVISLETDLPKGLYFIEISNEDNAQKILKFIVL